MAEFLSYHFAELVNLDVPSCGRKLSRSSNPTRKDPSGYVRLASPVSVCRCDFSIATDSASLSRNERTSFELRQSPLTHGNGHAQERCRNDKSRDPTTSICAAGYTNGIKGMDVLDSDTHNPQSVSASLENGIHSTRNTSTDKAHLTQDFVNDIHSTRKTSADKAHLTQDFDVLKSDVLQDALPSFQDRLQKGSSNPSSSSSSFPPISYLHIIDNTGDVLSSVAPLRVSDFSSILQQLKSTSKIEELFYWMKANCTTLDVHSLVFGELGKRQEWTVLDNLLRDEVKVSQGEATCEVFNKLFQVCINQGAPIWASKWFHFMMQEGVQPDLYTFKLIMPLFKRYEMFEDANFAHQHMHGIGVECSAASSAMILLYIQAGQLEKAKQIHNKMQEAKEEPLENLFISQLKLYVNSGRVKEAEELAEFLQESGIRFDISVYNAMITVNGKAGEYFRAKEWFFCIEKDGIQPNESTYRSIIGACGRAGNLHDALQFYDRMDALNFVPSLVNYNTLIHLHRKVDYDGRILALLSDMKLARCVPNSATLNSVLKVYERYGRLEKLPEAVQLLTEARWEPDETCYGFLIRAFIRCNMVDQAMEVFSKLCAVPKLEEIMCHNLICMCKSVGRYDEAIHVYHEMRRLKIVAPCLRTSCAVMDAYSLKGAIEEGEALYKELRSEQGLDAATYNVVIGMYLKAGIMDKAAEVLREVLQEKKLEPDLYLFLCMLKVCTKCGLKEEAVELYSRIVNSKMVWTESLYTGVIHCCGRLLPTEEIVKVFNAMMSTKTPVNNVTCNLLLDIFGKAGLLDKAERVLRLAQKQGVRDCITFSTMIVAYGKNKRFSEMESILIEMLNEGFKKCVDAYNSMLDAYGNAGKINKMEKTLERMRMAGCMPNLTTFNILIKVYGQAGLFEDLQRVLEKIKGADLKLDSYSFTTLIHAYGSANMLDEALGYFQEMQKVGFEPDLITYTCLISVLRAGGYRKEAARLSGWINTEGLL